MNRFSIVSRNLDALDNSRPRVPPPTPAPALSIINYPLSITSSPVRIAKVFFNVAGTICVGLGIAGIVLPLLPATPFFLLASACYVRGSDRLYLWLMNHPRLGSYIRNFRSGAGVPRRAKVMMIVMLWVSIAWSMVVVDITAVRIVLAAVLIGVTTLILKLKTLEENPEEIQKAIMPPDPASRHSDISTKGDPISPSDDPRPPTPNYRPDIT